MDVWSPEKFLGALQRLGTITTACTGIPGETAGPISTLAGQTVLAGSSLRHAILNFIENLNEIYTMNLPNPFFSSSTTS